MKALLIINPASGRERADIYVKDILNLLEKKGYSAELCETRGRGDARRFVVERGESLQRIVCCGGDGTLSEVINGVAELATRPVIAYIPTGTTNDFAKNLGLSSEILQSVIDLNHGTVQEIDIGKFRDNYFIYVASFGLFARSSYATPRSLKKLLGHLAYMITGTAELFKLRSYHLRVTDDSGKSYEDDYIYGSVSNSTSIGGLMHFDDSLVDLSDGMHEVVLVRRPKAPSEFRDLMSSILSGKNDSELLTVFSAKKVTIECDVPIDWSLDGEHERTIGRVDISNVSRAVRLIFPKKQRTRS